MADDLERLNERQRRFVLEYSKSGNGTRAAAFAGYSPKTARQIASRLLRNVKVQTALSDLSKPNIAETAEKTISGRERTSMLTNDDIEDERENLTKPENNKRIAKLQKEGLERETPTNVDTEGKRKMLTNANPKMLKRVETQTGYPYQDPLTRRIPSLREIEEWRRSRLAAIDTAIIGVQAKKDELRRRNGLLVYQVGDLRPMISGNLQAELDALELEYQHLRQERPRVEAEAIRMARKPATR